MLFSRKMKLSLVGLELAILLPIYHIKITQKADKSLISHDLFRINVKVKKKTF